MYGGPIERGTKQGYSDRERDDSRRHDFHPWPHEEHRAKRRWNDEEREKDCPKVLLKGERRGNEGSPEPSLHKGDKGMPATLKWGGSTSSENVVAGEGSSKHHVTFADSSEPKGVPVEGDSHSSPQQPAMRSQPKKIMLRKMGESRENEGSERQEHVSGGRGKEAAKGSSGEGEAEAEDLATPEGASKPRQAWKMTDRGPINSTKTLYEPEGKKSEAKFRRYQHDARDPQGKERGGHDSREAQGHEKKGTTERREKGGPSPATTPNEAHPPCDIPNVDTVREKPEDKVGFRRTDSAGEKIREGKGERAREGEGGRWRDSGRDHTDHPQRKQGSGRMAHERQDYARGRRDRERHDRERGMHERERIGRVDSREEYGGLNVPGTAQAEGNRGHHHWDSEEIEQQTQWRSEHSAEQAGKLDERRKNETTYSRPQEGKAEVQVEQLPLSKSHALPQSQTVLPQPQKTAPLLQNPPSHVQTVQLNSQRVLSHLQHNVEHGDGLYPEPKERPGRGQRLPSRGESSRPRDDRRGHGRGGSHSEYGRKREKQPSIADSRETRETEVREGGTGKPNMRQSVDHPSTANRQPSMDHPPPGNRKPILDHPPPTNRRPNIEHPVLPPTSRQPSHDQPPPPPLTASKRPPLLQDPPVAQRRIERGSFDGRGERRQREPQEGRKDSSRKSDRRRGPRGEGGRGEGGRGDGGGSERGRNEGGHEKGGRNTPRGKRDQEVEGAEGREQQRDIGLQSSEKEHKEERLRQTERGGRGDRRPKDGDRRGKGRQKHFEDVKQPLSHEAQPFEQSRRESGRGRDRRKGDRRERSDRSSQSDPPSKDSEGAKRGFRDSQQPTPDDRRGGGRGRREQERAKNSQSTGNEEGKRKTEMYGGLLDDIESGSDWDEAGEVEGTLQEVKVTRPEAILPTPSTRDTSSSQGRSEKRQRRREEGRPYLEESEASKKESGRSLGRGRGRGGGEQARERSTRLGGQRRAGRLGNDRNMTQEAGQETSSTAHEWVEGEAGEGKKGLAEKQLLGQNKHNYFEQFDLNSHKVAIVDNIRNQPEEQESMGSEFVEVTSKKAQKEKVKELRRQEVERRREEGRQVRGRKPTPTRSPTHPTAQPALKPSTTWGSKSDSTSQSQQPGIWSVPTASSEWLSAPLPSSSSAAPGSQLKLTGPVPSQPATSPSWPPAVGVIGEGLQGKPISAVAANQSGPAASSYTLFSVLGGMPYLVGAPFPTSTGMLSAAVDMKLSQEHLPAPPGDQKHLSAPSGDKKHLSAPSGDQTHLSAPSGDQKNISSRSGEQKTPDHPEPLRIKETQVEEPSKPEPTKVSSSDSGRAAVSSEVAVGGGSVGGSHAHGARSSLPPRLQSNKVGQQPGPGAGRGRSQRRGKGSVGRGERVGAGEQKDRSRTENKRENQERVGKGRNREKVCSML